MQEAQSHVEKATSTPMPFSHDIWIPFAQHLKAQTTAENLTQSKHFLKILAATSS